MGLGFDRMGWFWSVPLKEGKGCGGDGQGVKESGGEMKKKAKEGVDILVKH